MKKTHTIMFYVKIIAIMLVPSLYTVTYLASNADPYGNLNAVPVAIINEDTGVNVAGVDYNIGQEVTNGFIESDAFDFQQIKTEDFSYDDYYMKITIPENYSDSIVNAPKNNFKQAYISLEVDESKNYIFSAIAQEALVQMQSELNNEIIYNYMYSGLLFGDAAVDQINAASDLISNYMLAIDAEIDNSQEKLQNEVSTAVDKITSLTNAINSSKDQKINDINQYKSQVTNEYNSQLDFINSQLDNFKKLQESYYESLISSATNPMIQNIIESKKEDLLSLENDLYTNVHSQLSNARDAIIASTPQLNTNKVDLNIADNITDIQNVVTQFNDQIDTYQKNFSDKNYLNKHLTPLGDMKDISTFFSAPTVITEVRQNQVDTYGQGLAPFFVSLSLYVGALLVMTVTSANDIISFYRKKRFIYIPIIYSIICIGQVVILFLLMKYVNNIIFIHPVIFIMYSLLVSTLFLTFLLFLTYVFSDVGEFLGFILLVLQLGGSAGTFPIQTAPEFFQIINPFLPLTYTIDKYREILFTKNPNITFHTIIICTLIFILYAATYFTFKRREGTKNNVFKKLIAKFN